MGDQTTVNLSDLKLDIWVQLSTRHVDKNTVQGYVEAMAAGAQFPPVIVFADGKTLWLADGFHRVSAARFLGLTEITADVRPGTISDAMIYACTANVANGRPMSQAEKKEAAERLFALTDWSDREIARQLAVSQPSVSTWRHAVSDKNLSDSRPRTVTRNGTTYTMQTANIGKQPEPEPEPTPKIVDMKPEDYQRFWDEHIAGQSPYCDEGKPEWEEEDNDPDPPENTDVARTAPADHMAVHYSSDSSEHYTPPEIIDAALECLGFIDLDPCSNSHEHPNVPAMRHYTVADDGLNQEWSGFVYMNPPYGREIGDWIEKLCQEHEAGRVPEAIVLVPSRTDTEWWYRLQDDYVWCNIKGRLTFIGNNDPAPFASAVFYLGPNVDQFYYTFEHLGNINQRLVPGTFSE